MRILIVNLHSTANAGDHVLFQVLFNQLKTCPEIEHITLVANDPASFQSYTAEANVIGSFFYLLKKHKISGITDFLLILLSAVIFRLTQKLLFLPRHPDAQALLKAYLNADRVISCPGNFIYSRAHLLGLPILSPLSLLWFAHLIKKPYGIAPQTIGPLWRKWERWIVKQLLERAQFILLRDQRSAELLIRIGLSNKQYKVIPDLAFLYDEANDIQGLQLLEHFIGGPLETRGPYLGITVINWSAQHPRFKSQAAYEEGVANLIRIFLKDHPDGRVFFFPQVCGPTPADDDRIPAQRIVTMFEGTPEYERIHCVNTVLTPAVLRACYGAMDLFVGTRLHSNIFALTQNIPVIAIAYQDKTHGVMAMLGLTPWVIDIDRVEGNQLVSLYKLIWEQRHRVVQDIKNAVQECKERLSIELKTTLCERIHG